MKFLNRILQVLRFLHKAGGGFRVLPEARLLHSLVKLVDSLQLGIEI